jgi:DNA gyrase subunit A
VVAAFPVDDDDQVMLVTDQGKVIRIPVDGIRIASRNTQGVTLFDVAENEHVVAVARLAGAASGESDDDETDAPADTEADASPPTGDDPGADGPD